MAKRRKKTGVKISGKRRKRQNIPTEDAAAVVAHYLDGSLRKGTTSNFSIERDTFTLTDRVGAVEIITVSSLKALFFVKDVDGNRDYQERKGFHSQDRKGNKVMVEFHDGEIMFGHTHVTYSEDGIGFFMHPGDPNSNNIRVFIVRASTHRIKIVPYQKLVTSNV